MTVYQCLVELNELGYLKPLFLRHQINHFQSLGFLALFAFGDYAARGDSLLRAAACYQ